MSRFNNTIPDETEEDQTVLTFKQRELLTKALDLPFKAYRNDQEAEWQKQHPADAVYIIVDLPETERHCDFWLLEENIRWMENDFDGFMRGVTKPAVEFLRSQRAAD